MMRLQMKSEEFGCIPEYPLFFRALLYLSLGSLLILFTLARPLALRIIHLAGAGPDALRFVVLGIMALGGLFGVIIMFRYEATNRPEHRSRSCLSPARRRVNRAAMCALPLLTGLLVLLILIRPTQEMHWRALGCHLDGPCRDQQVVQGRPPVFTVISTTGIKWRYRDHILYSTMVLGQGQQSPETTLGLLGRVWVLP